MNELIFPVVGAMIVFFVAVPLLTVMARAILVVLPAKKDGVAEHVSPLRFALLVAPTLGPVIWLVSAAAHQSEDGEPLAACIVDHLGSELCRDVVLFGLVLFSVLSLGVLRRVRGEGRSRPVSLPAGHAASERVRSICEGHLTLARASSRIRVVEHGVAPACTRGLFRPRVEIEAALVSRLDDDELEAVLLHEVEHAQANDPLRFLVAQVALSINPAGRLLASELARYHFAREALCDRRAVQRGADPLALARSIVTAAGPKPAPAHVAAIGGHGIGGIRVRVQLLFGYASTWPGPARQHAPVGVVTSLVTLLAALPHVLGTGPLDMLHHSIERAAVLLGLS
ncbi:MAG: M56 family metallopeptidase [Deltaproteobacteria bacterium]|nr:M56 family metallopeptidase [Deltaproteobacteria bacterium]